MFGNTVPVNIIEAIAIKILAAHQKYHELGYCAHLRHDRPSEKISFVVMPDLLAPISG